ncbi:hypothetical protein ACFPOA_10270 [Lysobacter niabensis]
MQPTKNHRIVRFRAPAVGIDSDPGETIELVENERRAPSCPHALQMGSEGPINNDAEIELLPPR